MPIDIKKVTNGNVYIDGSSFLGRIEEVTLPEVKAKTIDHKAAGMEHEIELPAGGFEKMAAKYKFAGFYPEAGIVAGDPRQSRAMTVRAVIQKWEGAGLAEEVPLVIEMRGPVKGLTMGTLKQHEGPTPELEQNVWYYKVTVDGEELLEIDVMANIHRVAGADILATYRDITGA